MKILLVDDDKLLAQSLSENLTKYNFVVDTVADGETGWDYASSFTYDLILLDVLMPKLDGVSLCQRLRDCGHYTPIILLTASCNQSVDKVRGLNAGADDYLVKPFDFQELIARIRAILRRDTQTLLPLLKWGSLSLDPDTRKVLYQDRTVNLTPKQYSLLELFLRNQDRVFSPAAIIDNLWSSEEIPGEDTVRTHIKELRQKLKAVGVPQDSIETIYGQGYCLKSKPANIDEPIKLTEKNQSQYIAALGKIWQEYKQVFIDRLEVFEEVKYHLERGTLNSNLQQKAQFVAHTLAGTLGSFGKRRGSQLAIELEHLLQLKKSFGKKRQKQFLHLLSSLRAEIENINNLEDSHLLLTLRKKVKQNKDNLLIIDSDSEFARSLFDTALDRGIKTLIAPTVRAARKILAQTRVDMALLKVDFNNSSDLEQSLAPLESFRDFAPAVPLLVIADRANFSDRVEVIRRGGDTFLKQPVSPTFVIDTIRAKLNCNREGAKITVVDDDREFLARLPNLLFPWRFKIDIIEDPTQFWNILVKVNPDLLILNLEMSRFNAIELCRTVRSDPGWHHLPILFLTVDRDPQIRDLIFTSGADDLIYKPFVAEELAHRIINRLNRMGVGNHF